MSRATEEEIKKMTKVAEEGITKITGVAEEVQQRKNKFWYRKKYKRRREI